MFVGRWQPLHKGHLWLINERLKEGVEIFTVAKQTGHSMAICNQYYARLNIQSRADEATRRTYGKKKADEGELLF